jgi:hypothetical protein
VDDQDDAAYARAPEPEDLVRVCRALNEASARYVLIGGHAAAEVADTDVAEHTVVRVVDEIVIDLMGHACGLTFADVAADMERHDLGGVLVPIASPSVLIRTKNTLRPQDAIDRSSPHSSSAEEATEVAVSGQ